ncbi:unnamed protein product [Urochloa decumbens]|uniref:DUF4283 domain-containing protein n=1 Tax=Urochloa decumbens TaxID=240449 RepID=A0ABC9GC19_9POAL
MDLDYFDPTPGNPAVRPHGNPCYIDRDDDINSEEARLRLALVAQVGNSAIHSPEGAHAAIVAAAGVDAASLRVVNFYPESFLILPTSQQTRDAILNTNIAIGDSMLAVLPWTRVAHAELKSLKFKVVLELEGIPPHAWSLKVVRTLLAPYCWVKQADAAASSKETMDKFKVTAWTESPNAIATDVPLFITEDEKPIRYEDPMMQRIFGSLPPYLREKKVFRYPVIIHLKSVADFSSRSPSPSPSPPSSDGDSGHDGHPDRGYGETRGVGPRLHGFTCHRGIIDGGGAAPPAAGAAAPGYGRQCAGFGMGGRGLHQQKQKQKERLKDAADVDPGVTKAGAVVAPALSAQHDAARPPLLGHAATRDTSSRPTVEDRAVACSLERHMEHFSTTTQDPMLIEAKLEASLPATNRLANRQAQPEDAVLVLAMQQTETVQVETNQEDTAEHTSTNPPEAPSLDDGDADGVNAVAGEGNAVTMGGHLPCTEEEDGHPAAGSPIFPWLSPPVAQQGDAEGLSTQPTDSDAEAERELQKFAAQVQTKVRTPLAPLAPKKPSRADALPAGEFKLPQRSRRLASQPLSNVPAARRGEVLMMKRFGIIPENGAATMSSRKAYDALYREKLEDKEFAAARVLFPTGKAPSARPRRTAAVRVA